MPGLFGCLALDPARRLEDTFLANTFDRMKSRLGYLDTYEVDHRTDDSRRWFVARIGHAGLMGPDRHHRASGRSARACLYGTVYDSEKAPPEQGDPLLGIAEESGSFSAFCYEEGEPNRLALVADRRASEPLFYAESDGVLYFAPEVKALSCLDIPLGDPDPSSMASLLVSGFLLPHQTHFTGIRKLTSRHALIVQDGRFREIEYWRYEPGSQADGVDRSSLAEELADLVKKVILRDFGAAEETITFLSGGLDSRYILACLARTHREQAPSMNAVTWAEKADVPGSDPAVAAVVARELGIAHQFQARRHDRYQDWFRECNYLLDGQSDVPADHPHEFQIMRELRSQGFSRVIRGDEAFGLRGMVHSSEAALANIDIRPLAGIHHLAGLMTPEWYDRACEASRESFRTLNERGADLHPVDYKDVCYFSLRAPTYLSSAAYYKQILFDHRNPLLSNEVMDFYRKVPLDLRLDKKLFFQAFGVAHPDLAQIPYSSVPGTEDWGVLIATDTPLRRMMEQELADEGSGIWEVFDRNKVNEFFLGVSVASGTKKTPAWKIPLRAARDLAASLAPARMGQLALRRAQGKIRVSQVLFRIMVLKNWHDTFYAGRLDPPSRG